MLTDFKQQTIQIILDIDMLHSLGWGNENSTGRHILACIDIIMCIYHTRVDKSLFTGHRSYRFRCIRKPIDSGASPAVCSHPK